MWDPHVNFIEENAWSDILEESTVPCQKECEWKARRKYLSSVVVDSNYKAGLGPGLNSCGGTIFLPFVLIRHTYFHSGPFVLLGPDWVDPGCLFKPGPSHNNFVSRLTLKNAQALLSPGTTITHGHYVDMLDCYPILVCVDVHVTILWWTLHWHTRGSSVHRLENFRHITNSEKRPY